MKDTQPKSHSLGNQLIFWFLLLALSPLALVAWISYQQANSSLTQAASDELKLSAQLNVSFIQNWFNYRFADLRIQAEYKDNTELLTSLIEGLQKSQQNPKEFVKSDDWALRVDKKQNLLINLSRHYDYAYDLFLIDTQGNILYSVARERDLGSNLFQAPYATTRFSETAKETLITGKLLFSDLERYAPSNNSISGFLTAPIMDEFGETLGVFAIQIRIDQLFSLLHSSDKSGSISHYLVGEDGLLRTSIANNPNEILNKVISTKQFLNWRREHIGQETSLEKGEEETLFYMDPQEKKVIGIHNTVQISNTKWVLISEVEQDTALSAANWLGNIIVLLVFITSLLVVVIAVFQSRRITRPIIKLAEASMAVAAGEKEQQVEVSASNEINRLANAFNHMLIIRQVHEQALEKSHQEAQKALANLSDQRFALDQHAIVTITDVQGTITYANDKFSKVSGYTPEELLGQNHRLVKSGYHNTEFFQKIFRTIASGGVWHGEICNKNKAGALYWVDSTITAFMGKDGKPKSYIAIRTDITKRKEAELATQQTLSLLEATLESTDNGILVTNKEGKVLQTNQRFAELWNIPSALIVSGNEKAMLDYVVNQLANPQQFIEGIETLHNDENREILDTLDFADGRVYERISRPMMHEGKAQGRVWSFRDITERVHAQKSLLDAKNAAEAAVEAKGEFLASMSHEIRTPMNGVLGMLGLLLGSTLTDKQRHKALLAQTSAQSLLSLINDILDFSKVEAGKIELEVMDFNLRTMLGDFAEAMALRAQEKNIELVLDVTRIEQSSVKGDPGRLRQILTNIVGNAIKFTESGEIVIRAGLKEININEVIFYCSINDTGIGIPQEKISTLFDPFTQVDASTTRKYGGTGLGLSIVKKLCELMGGSISVSSELDNGTHFEFSVLFQSSQQSVVVMPRVSISELALLIVDDNDTNREVLVGQLEHWGAEVVEAKDGADALNCLYQRIEQPKKRPFDVALLDMQMPGMNGATLGKAIKADSHFDAMKLVMMTSMSHRGDAKYFAELGFSAYFPKPATTSDLFKALSVVVDNGDALNQASPLVTHHYLRTLDNNQSANALQEEEHTKHIKWPKKTRLLLVEDNAVNQEVALGVMEAIGLSADTAGDGAEALHSLNEAPEDAPYTLILMDCQMPEMDGYEASQNIRAGNAGERNLSIPIIAMTANAMSGDKEKCLQAGMSDYLTKPIDPDGLHAMLKKWLIASATLHPTSNVLSDDSVEIKTMDNTAVDSSSDLTELTEIWDKPAALKRLGGKEKLLNKLLVLFLSDTSIRVTELKQAVDEQDIEKIRILAHTIKGSTSNISGLQLQHLASEMEQAASKGDNSNFNTLMIKIDHAFKALNEQLSQHQAEEKT